MITEEDFVSKEEVEQFLSRLQKRVKKERVFKSSITDTKKELTTYTSSWEGRWIGLREDGTFFIGQTSQRVNPNPRPDFEVPFDVEDQVLEIVDLIKRRNLTRKFADYIRDNK